MPNPNESSGRRTNNNNERAAVACGLAKALSAVPMLRDADIDLASGRKAQNSSTAEARYPSRRRKALRPHAAVAEFGHCSIYVEHMFNGR
jgi:hypothetical protein